MINKDVIKNTKWEVTTLEKVSTFLDHLRKPITKSDRIEGEYNYYGANGKQGTINDYIFDYPTILLAEDGGNFGNFDRTIAYTVDGKYWVNNHAHVIKPNEEVINFDFLLRVLEKYDVRPFINGATRQKLNKSDALLLEIPLPPLPEQQRIAEILDKAEAINQKREQALALCDEFLRATFLDMFGDPVSNPKGWDFKDFAELGELNRGKSKHRPRNDPKLLGGDYPLIQTGDVANSKGYITNFISTYSEFGLKQSKLWSKGTLCITIAANIAKTGVLTFDACFPDSVVGFEANDLVTIEYIQSWLGFLQKTLEDQAPESAQKNINLAILKALSIPTPPIELQQKFSNIVEKVNAIKAQIQQAQELPLFDALSQQAFKGELTQ